MWAVYNGHLEAVLFLMDAGADPAARSVVSEVAPHRGVLKCATTLTTPTLTIPTLILHGKKDEVIPIAASRDFAISRPWVELVELDSDHALGNVTTEIWQAISLFCQLPEAVK